jgi:hypothetical protein
MKTRNLLGNSIAHDRSSLHHGGLNGIPSLLRDSFTLPRLGKFHCSKLLKPMVGAVQHIRRMRGGSQSHLMRCSDGLYYVVKFQDNPQHTRILANELLGTTLALRLGLPATPFTIVNVGEELIRMNAELFMRKGESCTPCHAGLQYGSRFVGDPTEITDYGFLPDERLPEVENLRDFLGIFVFDKWTCNTDGRQALFNRRRGRFHFRVTMIDQGNCFNAEEWNFPDNPLRGIYWRRRVYQSVKDLASFEPWLGRLEQDMNLETIEMAARQIPAEWYDSNFAALHHLSEWLDRRRMDVRRLIEETINYSLPVFPHWVNPCTQNISISH